MPDITDPVFHLRVKVIAGRMLVSTLNDLFQGDDDRPVTMGDVRHVLRYAREEQDRLEGAWRDRPRSPTPGASL